MNMNIDSNSIGKGLETVMNLSKVAANLSGKQGGQKPPEKKVQENNTTSQPHTQTVEVKVGDPGNNGQKFEKVVKETHIHKPFPDGRELSERECEVEKMRLQQEHELKMKDLEFRIRQEEAARAERKEREEHDRKDRERRQERNRRYNRRLAIGAGIFGAGVLGLAAYSIYCDSRRNRGDQPALPAAGGTGVTSDITGEGTVQ